MWIYTHLSYSKNGIYSGLKVLSIDVFLVFMPGVNTIANIIWLIKYPKEKLIINYNKLFRIK